MKYSDLLELATQPDAAFKFFEGWQQDSIRQNRVPWVLSQSYLPFLNLLTTDAITSWAFGPGETFVRSHQPWFEVIITTLLERFLLPVHHRETPEVIIQFTERVLPKATSLHAYLKSAPWSETLEPDVGINEQEKRYATLLKHASEALQQHQQPAWSWAVKLFQRLAAQRGLIYSSTANKMKIYVACAHDSPSSAKRSRFLRPGVIIPMNLGNPVSHWGITPSEVFSESFVRAVEQVRSLEPYGRPVILEDMWAHLGPKALSGLSGTFAIYLAQHLSRRGLRGRCYTLPPWVVMSATITDQGIGPGGAAGSVGLLREKIDACQESGVRVLGTLLNDAASIVAAQTRGKYLEILDLTPTLVEGIERQPEKLYSLGYLWPADADCERPSVVVLTDDFDDPDNSVLWDKVDECCKREFPPEEYIELSPSTLSRKTSILIALVREEEVIGFSLITGVKDDVWMFGSYIWISPQVRSDSITPEDVDKHVEHMLSFFKRKILEVCLKKAPNLKGIIFDIERPAPDHIKLADQEFFLRSFRENQSGTIRTVRQIKRAMIYAKHQGHPSLVIVDENGTPVNYRQPSMAYPPVLEGEVPMYLMVFLVNVDHALEAPSELSPSNAKDALDFLLDVFWPTRSWASREYGEDWVNYYRENSSELRNSMSSCNLAKLRTPPEWNLIRKHSRSVDPDGTLFRL